VTSRRILLHVGTPKTGTSSLQEVLHRNRGRLAEHGICYPGERFDAHFLAALDLMRLPWGGLEAEAVGAWDALAAQVRRHQGTTIISHEILARASRAQVARALRDLGQDDGAELHLVVSARDLVRQVPAEWQENVKHRATLGYGEFLDQLRDPERGGRIGSWFWAVQDLPAILDRWAGDLPAHRVHLITVPPHGADPDLLWGRFSEVFGLDGLDLDLEVSATNPSMGVPETALVRRLNRVVNAHVPPADYRPLVRELIVHQTLSRRSGSPRLTLPPDLHPWVTDISDRWIEDLRARGVHVVGDLEDLRGAPVTDAYADPDHPRERQVSAAALDAVRVMVGENARLRGEEDRLRAEVDELRHALHRAAVPRRQRVKERAYAGLQGSGPGRAALRLYRRARGRSSRSA
jgi:hypothetical protein